MFIEIKLKNDFKGETESKFNLGQLNAYKLMFAMKVSMENEQRNLDCWISLPMINATIFRLTYVLILKPWRVTVNKKL